jgi:hypothetical protein
MSAIDVKSEGPSARTVGAILDDAAERIGAAGVDDARTDAEVLVADALGVEPSQLSVESAGEVGDEAAEKIERNVQRRVEREPMAYILGRAPFRNLEIYVDERVLWPRRETELLVEVGTQLPEGARVHEVGSPCSPSGPTSGSPPRTSRPKRSKPRVRTPSGSASTSRSASPAACPSRSKPKR